MTGLMQNVAEVVAWTLLHSVWQFAFAWAGNAVLQRLLRTTPARVRYAVACTMLLGGLLAVCVTAMVLVSNPTAVGRPTSTNGLFDLVRLERPSAAVVVAVDFFQRAAPLVVIAWAAVAVVRAGNTLMGLRELSAMRGRLLPVIVDEAPACWQRLKARLVNGRRVGLAECYDIITPAMFGWLKPVVVVPVGFFSGNSPAFVEAVLAHELAHVARRDFLVNALQMLVEACFWFHPAVISLSAEVRALCEKCCDEAAVRASATSAQDYSSILSNLVAYRKATLAKCARSGDLYDRLANLVAPRRPSTAMLFAQVAGVSVLMLGSLGFTSSTVASVVAEKATTLEVLAKPLNLQVCEVLGSDRDNPAFVPAVVQAVIERNAKRFDAAAARRLAGVISAGARPHALLAASESSFDARRLAPVAGSHWSGGGNKDWDAIAYYMFTQAQTEPDRHLQTLLGRASLILAAQDRLTPGGPLQKLLRAPALKSVAGVSVADSQRLFSALSADALQASRITLRIQKWSQSNDITIPKDIAAAAVSEPWVQWRVANTIIRIRLDDPPRAGALEASARGYKELSACVRLLGGQP